MTRTRVNGCWNWNGVAQAQVIAQDHESLLRRVSLGNDVAEEARGTHVNVEGLDLENDLDDAVDDGKKEINKRESGKCDAIHL